MKKLFAIFAALCMVSMSACFSSWDGSGDQGNIVINLGNSGARAVGLPGGGGSQTAAQKAPVKYTVILTNSGETSISQTTSGGTVGFSVQPGNWHVLVRADSNGTLSGYGETDVEVRAGATSDALVTVGGRPTIGDVEITEVVSAWTDLKKALEKATGDQQEYVLLTRNLRVNSSIEISSGGNITLLAKDRITITKGDVVQNSLFRVIWGSSLTLGAEEEMPGTITVDGCGYKPRNSSLFYVGNATVFNATPPDVGPSGGTLAMYEGVTLTNNYATLGDRGGAVVVQGGTFTMHGGTISGNTAPYGGGVRILSGNFIQIGGTIYGSGEGSKSNKATNSQKRGHAVYGAYTAPGSNSTTTKFQNTTSTGRLSLDNGHFEGSWESN